MGRLKSVNYIFALLPLILMLHASCVSPARKSMTADSESTEVSDENAENAVEREYAATDEVVVSEEAVDDSVLEVSSDDSPEPSEEANAAAAPSGNVAAENQALSDLLATEEPPAEQMSETQPEPPAEQMSETQPEPPAEQMSETQPEPPVAPVSEPVAGPASGVVPPPAAKQVLPKVAAGKLYWIGYNYVAKEGSLVIDLRTKGSPRYVVFQEINRANQPELVVRLFGTNIRRPIRRSIDASEFRSPVSYIRTRSNPKNTSVDVILTLRESVQPKLMARAGGLSLTYRIPDHWYGVQPNRKVASAAPAEMAEPLANSNLYPVFESGSRMPDTIDANNAGGSSEKMRASDSLNAAGSLDPVSPASIPPQGTLLRLRSAGGAWMVGQDNGMNLNEMTNMTTNAAVTAPANQVGNAAANAAANQVGNTSGNAARRQPQSEASSNQANIAAISANPGADLLGQDQAGRVAGSASRKINLDFRGAPLSEVIKAITDKSGVNFIYAGALAAIPVTIQLQDIAWDVAFKSILDLNAMGLVKIANNLYRVDNIGNIAREREQIEAAKIASQRLEPTRIMFLRLSYAQATEAVTLVSEMLANARARDPRIQIRAETRTNSLIVEAPTRELARVKTLVERIDLQTPQVKVESRVVEVVKTLGNTFGISWGGPFNFDQSKGLGFGSLPFPNFMRSDYAVEAGGSGAGVGSMNFLFGSINSSFNLDLHLRMSESEGFTETLQTNSVIVQNNQSATISGGQSDVFVLGASAPGTAPQVLTVDYSMNVSVTPTVTADGSVRMSVTITSSSPSAAVAAGATSGRYSRNINTVLLRRSGETAVIGGLNTRERADGWGGIPILSRIPIIGALFRSSVKTLSNRELLLMVTPTIMNVVQSTGDGGATFEDDAGTASSASPDKLDTSGSDSEFRAEDVENAVTKPGNMANNAAGNNNNAAGNNAPSNNGANALNEALNEVNSENGGNASGVNSGNNASGNSANDALGGNNEGG